MIRQAVSSAVAAPCFSDPDKEISPSICRFAQQGCAIEVPVGKYQHAWAQGGEQLAEVLILTGLRGPEHGIDDASGAAGNHRHQPYVSVSCRYSSGVLEKALAVRHAIGHAQHGAGHGT